MEKKKTNSFPPKQHGRHHRFLLMMCALLLVLLGLFIGSVAVSLHRIKTGGLSQFRKAASSSFTRSGSASSAAPHVERSQVEESVAPSLGPSDAPLTIVEFGDFDCPYTQASLFTVKQMLQEFPGKFRLLFRNFPIPSLHPTAEHAAEAAMCANDQHKFWEYYDLLLLSPGQRTDGALVSFAQQLGINTDAFQACLANTPNAATIQRDMSVGLQSGVEGTPTWFFNGYRIEGALSVDNFRKVVQLGVAGKLK